MQGRFRYLTENDIEIIQTRTDEYYEFLFTLNAGEKPLNVIMGDR